MKYYSELGYDKVLVYDNGSTDKTVEMLRQYPFVEVITYQTEKFDDYVKTKHLYGGFWDLYRQHVPSGYVEGVTELAWVTVADFDEVVFYTRQDYITFKEYLKRISKHGYNVCNEQMVNLISDYPPNNENEFAHLQVDKCIYGDPFDWRKPILFRLDNIYVYNLDLGQHAAKMSFLDQDVKTFNHTRNIHVFHLKYILGLEGLARTHKTKVERGLWSEDVNYITDYRGNYRLVKENAIDINAYFEHKMLTGIVPGEDDNWGVY